MHIRTIIDWFQDYTVYVFPFQSGTFPFQTNYSISISISRCQHPYPCGEIGTTTKCILMELLDCVHIHAGLNAVIRFRVFKLGKKTLLNFPKFPLMYLHLAGVECAQQPHMDATAIYNSITTTQCKLHECK